MDHRRVDISGTSISRGVSQISRLSDEMDPNLFAVGTKFYHVAHGEPPAFVIWSNLADQETNGHRFCQRIMELKLGQVFTTPGALNPNTGSIITLWSWLVDHERFKEWYKQTKIEKLKNQYPNKGNG